MIVAIGFDIVDLERIGQVWRAHPDRFLSRHFTEDEISYCRSKNDPLPSLAARFAAKEAFQKCWHEPHGWRDVWVVGAGGKPSLAFSDEIEALLEAKGWRAHVTLTHARDQAGAVVVLESAG